MVAGVIYHHRFSDAEWDEARNWEFEPTKCRDSLARRFPCPPGPAAERGLRPQITQPEPRRVKFQKKGKFQNRLL